VSASLNLSLTQLVTNPTYINRVIVHDCLPLTFTLSFRDELALVDHEQTPICGMRTFSFSVTSIFLFFGVEVLPLVWLCNHVLGE